MRIPFLAVLVLFASMAVASAHSSLVSVDPPDGAVLQSQPATLVLRFNEPVSPTVVRLIDAAGHAREDIAVEAHDTTVAVRLPATLPRGTQTVSYRIISADGHPVGGSVLFSIGTVTGRGASDAATEDGWRAASIWASRLMLYVGLLVGVGGTVFLTWVHPGDAGRFPAMAALGVGLVATPVSIGLQGLDVLGSPLPMIVSRNVWQAALATSLAPSLAVAAAAMALALGALQLELSWKARVLSGLALAGVGATFALSGHASSAMPTTLTRPAIFLHGMCAAFWVGALCPLLVLVRRADSQSLPALHRFSDAAVPLVAVLVMAGVILAGVQMETWSAFVTTAYGRILAAKILLVTILLALAALNRLRFMAAPDRLRQSLGRSIAAEGVLAMLVLGLVAGWRFTPPPRALAATMSPIVVAFEGDGIMSAFTVSPARAGRNTFEISLMDAAMSAMKPKDVTVTFSLPKAGIEPFQRSAAPTVDGLWVLDDVTLPQPGDWHVQIGVLVDDFHEKTLEGDIGVRP